MNAISQPILRIVVMIGAIISLPAHGNDPSGFDEAAIRSIQESRGASAVPQAFVGPFQAFEASSDPIVKAAKWEETVVAASEGMLVETWTAPAGGWKLLDFPASGKLSLQAIADQQSLKASNTKLIAQNETEAARLRGAGGLMLSAALEGEQWGEKLLLAIAQRPDSNIKRLAYWFTKDFAADWLAKGESVPGVPAPVWAVNWDGWQQAYDAANPLGKAIILRNITMLAVRRNEVTGAAAINLSALSGTDRELKAIALAFGDPALGSAVTAKWLEIAGNVSDPQMQALAQEARSKFGIDE